MKDSALPDKPAVPPGRHHMALVWTGHGRTLLKIVPRRGSVVYREVVEKVPSGLGNNEVGERS
jgi:hypothetical protein